MAGSDSRSGVCRLGGWTLGVAIGGIVCLVAIFGCRSESRAPEVEPAPKADTRPVLRVGTAASAPPFVFQRDGRVVGLEIDLANELAGRLNRRPRVISMYFENLPEELRRNRIDIIMAGMSITPERRATMAFSEPYLRSGQRLLILTDSAVDAENLDRGGSRIGVENDSTGSAYARSTCKRAEVVNYPTLADAVDALRRKQITAVIHDAPAVAWVVQQDGSNSLYSPPAPLTDEAIAWATNVDDPDLLAEVNAALVEMQADGTLDRLVDKWVEPR